MIDYFLMPHPPIIIPEVGKGAEKEVSKTIESCRKVGDIIEVTFGQRTLRKTSVLIKTLKRRLP